MSSILTNTSALVALQSLKAINVGMGKVENEISTGTKVATARENSSSWSIASTMNSDVSSYSQPIQTTARSDPMGGSSTISPFMNDGPQDEFRFQISDGNGGGGSPLSSTANDSNYALAASQPSSAVEAVDYSGLEDAFVVTSYDLGGGASINSKVNLQDFSFTQCAAGPADDVDPLTSAGSESIAELSPELAGLIIANQAPQNVLALFRLSLAGFDLDGSIAQLTDEFGHDDTGGCNAGLRDSGLALTAADFIVI